MRKSRFWCDSDGARPGDLVQIAGLRKFFEIINSADESELTVSGYGRALRIPRKAIVSIAKREGVSDVGG